MHHIVEITSHGVSLRKGRGHLIITKDGNESKVPLDDIAAVIISGGTLLSSEVLKSLSKRGAPVVLADDTYTPTSMMLPYFQHHKTQDVLALQISVTKPLRKKIWTRIVKEKILNQRELLAKIGASAKVCDRLAKLADTVRSGDPDNKEAQAALLYWPALFGDSFLRRTGEAGINGLLNYTYAVLRSSMARSVVATGLHPALGLFHKNRKNAFCLVDDLIEPFRAVGDALVWRLSQNKEHQGIELKPKTKMELVKVLYLDQLTSRGQSPIFQCMRDLALSVCESYRTKSDRLTFPNWELPWTF